MECLVDDKMNSNLPSCPKCGLDTAGAPNMSQSSFSLCENCKSAISSAVVNNNPMPQTHRDFVPYPNVSPPRWCTCTERTLTTTFPPEYHLTSQNVDVPMSRPRSSSSPYSIMSHPSYTLSSQTLGSEPSPSHGHSPAQSHTPPANQSLSSRPQQSDSPASSPADASNAKSCDDHQTTSHFPCSSPPPSQDEVDEAYRPRVLSDSTRCSLHNSPELCKQCGGVTRTRDKESGSNINKFYYHRSLPSSGGTALGSSSIASSPPLETSTTSSARLCNQNLQLSPSKSPTGRRHVHGSGEFKTKITDSPPSAFGRTSDSPRQEAGGLKWDHLKGKGGVDVSPRLQSRSEIINHNMKHNRMTTVKVRTSPRSSKSSRNGRRPKQLLGGAAQSGGHLLHRGLGGSGVMEVDSPLCLLPQDLLYELHDLSHENDDLSADVVYSLQLKNYGIQEILGKGISSTVRRVAEKTTGVEYAVKIIDISGEKGESSQVEQTKKDTIREIRILRMCAGHPNIIELHDVFETPTFIFLVFEICKKGELFDYLTSVVSLSEKRTRIFMRQLIEAVDSFHDKDIVHRDLKPENILLDDELNIKVSDFGFATIVQPNEELTELCGTPGYLAPEVLAHSMYENVSGYGKEVDMWACGVIMYTLLCGAPPFWNRRQMMMLRAIMSADYTFNSPEWDDITDAPKNLIQKLLVVNPRDRLTAKQALNHPFFHSQEEQDYKKYKEVRRATLATLFQRRVTELVAEEKKFHGRKKFRVGAFCVIFYLRLSYYYKHPAPISVDTVRSNPYSIKIMRKVIDTCAFGMYKHWVKRVDNQNRAALFEHTLRDDWKHNLMTLDGVKG